ncbi:polysaccharide deacetylase family protein [Vagococcus acidifermentans]|nr:polysaccharide deacetylase family protein [Vagococcus acidifermentans]
MQKKWKWVISFIVLMMIGIGSWVVFQQKKTQQLEAQLAELTASSKRLQKKITAFQDAENPAFVSETMTREAADSVLQASRDALARTDQLKIAEHSRFAKQKQSLVKAFQDCQHQLATLKEKQLAATRVQELFNGQPLADKHFVPEAAVREQVTLADVKNLRTEAETLPDDAFRAVIDQALSSAELQVGTSEEIQQILSQTISDDSVVQSLPRVERDHLRELIGYIRNESLQEQFLVQLSMINQQSEPAEQQVVALTFDDGPNDSSTVKILDILKKYKVKATFFVLGSMAEKYPAVLKRINDDGHEIGNHSYAHSNLSVMTDKEIQKDITQTNELIAKHSGQQPGLLRPPYGAFNQKVVQAVPGMRLALWDIDTLDWQVRNGKKIVEKVEQHVKNGDIILMHDIHKTTANGVEPLIKMLIKKGYTFRTVSQL